MYQISFKTGSEVRLEVVQIPLTYPRSRPIALLKIGWEVDKRQVSGGLGARSA